MNIPSPQYFTYGEGMEHVRGVYFNSADLDSVDSNSFNAHDGVADGWMTPIYNGYIVGGHFPVRDWDYPTLFKVTDNILTVVCVADTIAEIYEKYEEVKNNE